MIRKPLLMVLLCLPVIGLAGSAFAALCETEAQMAERCGPSVTGLQSFTEEEPEVQAKYHYRVYFQEPYLITAIFDASGLVQSEKVEKRRTSLGNKRHIAQEFSDREIQAFLEANSSYDGAFEEQPSIKGSRGWVSANVKAVATLRFVEETFKGGEKAMIQTLEVETADFEKWSWDRYRKKNKIGSQQ